MSESTDSGTGGAIGSTKDVEISDEERQQMEAERQERLADENRPDNAEIDNSDRDFDVVKGQFTDDPQDTGLGPFNDPNAEDGEPEA